MMYNDEPIEVNNGEWLWIMVSDSESGLTMNPLRLMTMI